MHNAEQLHRQFFALHRGTRDGVMYPVNDLLTDLCRLSHEREHRDVAQQWMHSLQEVRADLERAFVRLSDLRMSVIRKTGCDGSCTK